jgi:DNA gyrase subunit A
MERGKIQAEFDELQTLIAELKEIISSEPILLQVIKTELLALRDKYANDRKTELFPEEGDFRMEDIIPNTGCMITVTQNGFIKRTSLDEYRAQRRGGRGVLGAGQREEDKIEHLFSASTHDNIMFIMKSGKVFIEKVYDIPEGARQSKGRSIANLLNSEKTDGIASMITFEEMKEDISIVMCTKNGIVKKTEMMQYKNRRREGIKGIVLDDDDYVISAKLCTEEDELLLVSLKGNAIRFKNERLRKLGRVSRGVIAIRFRDKDDQVVTMETVDNEKTILVAGVDGIGKRSEYEEYRETNRGGLGVIAIRTDKVAGALSVSEDDEIMLITKKGIAVRTPVKDIRVAGRATKGVKLINLTKGDSLVGISKVIATEEDELAAMQNELATAVEEDENSTDESPATTEDNITEEETE